MEQPDLVEVQLTRSSVCLGDDCDAPHLVMLSIPRETTVRHVVQHVMADNYLPSIQWGCATWIVECGRASTIGSCLPEIGGYGVEAMGRPLAVVAQQWDEPRYLGCAGDALHAERDVGRSLFVRYWCQADPELVFERLARGETIPGRYG